MRLKELRQSRDKTQEDISKLINTSITCYNYYEKEKREPTIETLCRLADFYDVSLDYLVGRDYKDDIGYLNPDQKNVVYVIKQLNEKNLSAVLGQSLRLLNEQ